MSYLDDLLQEPFAKDDSDDSDAFSLTDSHSLYSKSRHGLSSTGRRSRSIENDTSDAEIIEEHIGSSDTGYGNFSPLRKRSFHLIDEGFGSPPSAFHWEDNLDYHSESRIPSSDGLESSSDEVEWDYFFKMDEIGLPVTGNWEPEFHDQKDRAMAASAYKGLCYQSSVKSEDEHENPWYPCDPHNYEDETLSDLIDDEEFYIEPLDEERIVCYGMVHNVTTKVLARALEPLKEIHAKASISREWESHNFSLFSVMRQADGPGFLLQAPSTDDVPVPEQLVAALNKEIGVALSNISTLCIFEAYSSSAQWKSIVTGTSTINDSTHAFVDINIYGKANTCEEIGQILDRRKIFLQEPNYRNPDFGYKNPHVLYLDAMYPDVEGDLDHSRSALLHLDLNFSEVNINEQAASQKLKQKIATAFKGTTRAQNLDRIKADPRIHTELKSYQEEGLDFIKQRETGPIPEQYLLWNPTTEDGSEVYTHAITKCKVAERPVETGGGILADEMGLGKTLTMLCAIIGSSDNAREAAIYAELHKSGQLDARPLLISSRATLVVVPSRLLLHEWENEIKLQPLWQIDWFRVILDEAHIIRRMSTRLFKAMKKLHAKYRWCLTGTPVQNSPEDLAALMSFIHASPLHDIQKFRKFVANPLMKQSQEGVENLRQLLDSVCLRRTKELLRLPEAIIDTKELDLSDMERRHYVHVRDKLVKLINQNVLLPKNHKKKYLDVFQLQLQLRRLCNHGTFQKLSLGHSEFDPHQAIAHLQQQAAATCEYCGVKITGIQGIEEERSGIFTACGHLICYKCKPGLEVALQSAHELEGSFKCSICHKIMEDAYFLDQGDPKKSGQSRQLSAWEYFSKSGYSTKVSAIVSDIERSQKTDGKSIVFSCWTRSLDLVGMFLGSRDPPIPFFRIDGTQNPGQRKKILEAYQHNPVVKVLLMTTGIGAFGLNLTVANCVYILEPQWNPMVEYQAIARVLRLGQIRNVRVVRYIMKDTVEGIELQPQQLRKLGYAKAGWKDGTHTDTVESYEMTKKYIGDSQSRQ